MGNAKCFLRAFIPLALFVFSLAYFIYTKVTGFTPIRLPGIEEMKSYGPLLLPILFTAMYIVRAGAALTFAFLTAGFIGELVPRHILLNYLSSTRNSSYLLAALLAPLLTVCSCVMLPVFAGLVYAGAGIGPAIAFLLTAPAANIMAVILTADIISWKIAIARLVAAILIAVFTGYVVSKTSWARSLEEKYRLRRAISTQLVEEKRPLCKRLWSSFKLSGYLARMILPYVLLGIAIVSYIQAYLPPKIVSMYLSGYLGIVLGAVIGVPMYTPTLVEVILVDTLRHAGMSASAALAFLIGGPMTSIPSMIGASRIVGWKMVALYAVLAVIGAIIAGLTYHFILGDTWWSRKTP